MVEYGSHLATLQERGEDDANWAAWLDGFLCVLRNDKITRLTLKFAVYLDCLYQVRLGLLSSLLSRSTRKSRQARRPPAMRCPSSSATG